MIKPIPEILNCKSCGRQLPKQYFYVRERGDRWYCNHKCKECSGHKPTKISKEGFKICGKCGRELLKTEDNFYRTSNGYLKGRCKECWVKYRIANRDANIAYQKSYRQPINNLVK